MVKKVEEPINAHVMPSMRIVGSLLKAETLRILFLIVSATRALSIPISIRTGRTVSQGPAYPTSTAPANSHTVAINMACLMVKDRDDTDVANELATYVQSASKCSVETED